jgi:ABC-type multidrug transport system ATPase subunit
MENKKKTHLEEKGWKVGTAQEFLGLTKDEETSQAREIDIKSMSFSYNGKIIFEDLNLNIKENESVLIAGPNGRGKSTLAHILSNFLKANGSLKLIDQKRISAMLAPLNFVPGTLKDHLSFDTLSLEKKKLGVTILRDFGSDEKLEQDPATFSEGEKRKAYIITSLLKDADGYIFDEPLAAIDVDSKDRVIESIFKYTEGRILVVIMHEEEKFHSRFDKVIKLEPIP